MAVAFFACDQFLRCSKHKKSDTRNNLNKYSLHAFEENTEGKQDGPKDLFLLPPCQGA